MPPAPYSPARGCSAKLWVEQRARQGSGQEELSLNCCPSTALQRRGPFCHPGPGHEGPTSWNDCGWPWPPASFLEPGPNVGTSVPQFTEGGALCRGRTVGAGRGQSSERACAQPTPPTEFRRVRVAPWSPAVHHPSHTGSVASPLRGGPSPRAVLQRKGLCELFPASTCSSWARGPPKRRGPGGPRRWGALLRRCTASCPELSGFKQPSLSSLLASTGQDLGGAWAPVGLC